MKQALMIFCLIFLFGGNSSNEAKTVQDNPREKATAMIYESCQDIDSLGASIDHLRKCVQ